MSQPEGSNPAKEPESWQSTMVKAGFLTMGATSMLAGIGFGMKRASGLDEKAYAEGQKHEPIQRFARRAFYKGTIYAVVGVSTLTTGIWLALGRPSLSEFTKMMQTNLPNPSKPNLQSWQITNMAKTRQLLGSNKGDSEHAYLKLTQACLEQGLIAKVVQQYEDKGLMVVGMQMAGPSEEEGPTAHIEMVTRGTDAVKTNLRFSEYLNSKYGQICEAASSFEESNELIEAKFQKLFPQEQSPWLYENVDTDVNNFFKSESPS